MRAECRTLELVCAWADLHTREPGEYSPLVERAKFYGGAGTPEISEFCVAELAALQGTGMLSAQLLMADALDLRHRLPRLWTQVQAGQVRGWHARKVAEMTRPLSWEACAETGCPVVRDVRAVAVGTVPAHPGRGDLGRRPGAGRTARRAGPEAAGCVGHRLRGRVEDDHRPRRGRGRGVVHGHRQPDRRDPRDRRRHRLGRAAPVKGDRHRGPARQGAAIARRAPRRFPAAEDGEDDDHRSLDIDPPSPAQVRSGRPRVVLVFHLSDAAISRGHGMVRPEHGDPLSLDQLQAWLAETGCARDRAAGGRPGRSGPDRCLRDPAMDARRGPAAQPRRRVPVRLLHHRHHGPGPHHPLATDGAGRAAGPDSTRQPRTVHPQPPPDSHPRPMATTTTRAGTVRVPLTHRHHLSGHQPRNPTTRHQPIRRGRLARCRPGQTEEAAA